VIQLSKVVDVETAVGMIKDGDTVVVDGITFGCPEELCCAVEDSYLKKGKPANIVLFGPGGTGNTRGLGFDHFAHEGLMKTYVGSYLNLTRKLDEFIRDEKAEGYLIPLGVSCHLLREISAGRPGIFKKIGLKTYIDPRIEGGRLNSISRGEDYVPEIISLHGEEYLFFKSFKIDVALIRGTTADEDGNITLEKEAGIMNGLEMAMAAKKCGGIVIAQVERIAARGTLKPMNVRIPGILVDFIVIASPKNHMQTWREQYNPAISGEIKLPISNAPLVPFDLKKVVARRAVLELRPGAVVNLGAGMSEFVSSVSWEEGINENITFVIEAGMIGGVPGFGLNFNTAVNATCILSQSSILDYLDGGGHDFSFLGFAQFDKQGNVNVSKVLGRIPGIGGFHNVAPTAKQRFHCGAFTAGKSDIRVEDGRLRIVKDGNVIKFVDRVDQISASGEYALDIGQPTTIITERCVFEWTREGLVLTEIAPGVNIEENILKKMQFKPIISRNLKEMPADIFKKPLLNLKNKYPWNQTDNSVVLNLEHSFAEGGEKMPT
jgi:propionate CoA-transferase